ncbi:hypothetical protein Tco_0177630, partial [Tanacetum coccineum]
MIGETSKKDEGGMSMTFQCPILNSTNYTIWAVKIKELFNVYEIWDALEPKGEVGTKTNTMAIAYLFQALPEQLTLQISQLVSQASNLGSTIENKRLVRKLLGSVPTKFIQIVAAIEQFVDL